MSLTPREKCTCGCHKAVGFFHCFTGPCCDDFDQLGEFLAPVKERVKLTMPEKIIAPAIAGEVWPDITKDIEANSVKDLEAMAKLFKDTQELPVSTLEELLKETDET